MRMGMRMCMCMSMGLDICTSCTRAHKSEHLWFEGKSSLQVRKLRVLEDGREGFAALDAEIVVPDAASAQPAHNVNGR